MPFDRIAAALASLTSHKVVPYSSARVASSDSSAASCVGRGQHSGGATEDSEERSFLQVSSSLQDFSTFSVSDQERGGGGGLDWDHVHGKQSRGSQRDGGRGVGFSKEKSSSSATGVGRKKWARMASFALCIGFMISLIFVCSMYISGRWSRRTKNYYVILDCGSTGTRVYVYEWSINPKGRYGGLPIALRSLPEGVGKRAPAQSGRAYQRMETEPGLDKLVRNESGLKAAMMPLLHWAENQIPKHAHKSTSVYLYATAGVRRLPASDSKWLLAKAWMILKRSSFLCHKDWVKIISGMEEAYYGWIALNFHKSVLGSLPAKQTFGSLDLGGSSLQVTFETKEAMHDEASLKLSIGEVNHFLSAYSLSGYGLNDAFDRSVLHLSRQLPRDKIEDLKNGRIVLKHPCLQTDYKDKYLCSQCMALNKEGIPLIGGKNTGKRQKRVPIELLGAPQWEECSALAKATVNLSEWSGSSAGIDCDTRPCALAENVPSPHGQFYAMSGFFVVFKFFNLTSDASLDDLLQKGQEFCEKPWIIAKNSVMPQPFIEQYCFRAPYVASLLRDGLHIGDSNVVIGSGTITWTLGVALLEAGQASSSRMDFPGYIMLPGKLNLTFIIILLVSPLLAFCAISFAGNWMRRSFRRAYLPLFRPNNVPNGSVRNVSSPFKLHCWSHISSGDARVKAPLSPVADSQQHHFGSGFFSGGNMLQFTESPSDSCALGNVSHSYSSGCLGQMHSDNGKGMVWVPHRSQMRLQSRRSQSREDLSSSLADAHLVKS